MDPIKLALGIASPAGARARLSIFIFHRVLPEPDPLFPEEPDAARFDTLLAWIASWFNVLPLDEAVERLKRGSLPARAASITFDDGYADNCTVALPILKRHGLPATFFIATGYLDGGCMWNDRVIAAIRGAPGEMIDLEAVDLGTLPVESMTDRRAAIDAILGRLKYLEGGRRDDLANAIAAAAGIDIPGNLMLSTEQVREIRLSGMGIGAHTVTHPILARIPLESARREAKVSGEHLQDLIGEPIALFAYPNGRPGTDYHSDHVDLMREIGFRAAVSTSPGAANGASDVMQLPRFTPWDGNRGRFGLRALRNLRSAQALRR